MSTPSARNAGKPAKIRPYLAIKRRLSALERDMELQWDDIMEKGYGTASVFWDDKELEWRLLRWILKLPNLYWADSERLKQIKKSSRQTL